MEKQKLNLSEINAWRCMQFHHGLKTQVRDRCRQLGRTTTTYNLIRAAFDQNIPDTPVQRFIRETALNLINHLADKEESEISESLRQLAVHETAN